MTAQFQLSTLTPDYDGIRAQLQVALAHEKVWSGNDSSPLGASLLNVLSTIGTLDQHKILRATQDCFPETAISDRAIYSAQDFLGARLARKVPAKATASLSSPVDITIPAFTQFQSSGTYFFNRDAIKLQANVAREVFLWQGQINSFTTYGLGTNFQMYSPPESTFSVSNDDVQVRINSQVIKRVIDGLWNYPETRAFQDRTLPDGRLMIHFGSAAYGASPGTTDLVTITYAVTSGALGNSVTTVTNSVVTDFSSDVTGSFLDNPTGGANEFSAQLLKSMPSPTFGSFDSAVTKRQILSTLLSYPGVIDAKTFSQREVNPRALEWFCMLRFVLLTDHAWNATEKEAFTNTVYPLILENAHVKLDFAVPTPVDVEANVYFYNYANLAEGKADVEAKIAALLTPRRGMIDFDVYRSDFGEAIKNANSAISHYEILSPSSELVIVKREAAEAPAPVLHADAGNLIAGKSLYGVLVNYPDGHVTVRNWVEVDHAADTSVELSWSAVPGAVSYGVYVEGDDRQGLLATVSDLEFTDFGDTSPTGKVPAFSTAPVRYPELGTLKINVAYSKRTGA